MARRNLRYDFQLAGRGYLLSRATSTRGRAWTRQGTPDTPLKVNSRTEEQAKYGGVDPQIDYPEVWDDWSGGYGHAYRDDATPNTYHWSENMDARFPKQLVHCQFPSLLASVEMGDAGATIRHLLTEGLDGICDGNFQFSANGFPNKETELMFLGRLGWGYGGSWDPSQIYIDTATISDYSTLFPAVLFGSSFVFGSNEGTQFTQIKFDNNIQACGMSGHRFAVAGNQLWKAGGAKDNAVYLQNCGNPAGIASPANWGATYAIGNFNSPIKSLIGLDDQVFAGTPKGLYAGDQTGTFVNVLSQLSNQSHPDNCRDLTIFEGTVVAPHVAGIFAYRPNVGAIEDLSTPRTDRSPVTGRIRAVRAFGRYLYAGLYTGSQSWLLSGERKGKDMAWHTLQHLPNTVKVGRICLDGIMRDEYTNTPAPNTFYVCTEASIDPSGTAPTYWWKIPSLDGNPLGGSPGFSANYCGSARIDFGSSDWDAPGTSKVYRSAEIVSENLASGAQWADVYYTIDEKIRAKLGTVAVSPKDTLYFPVGVNAEKCLNGGFETDLTGWGASGSGSAYFTSTSSEVHSGVGAMGMRQGAGADEQIEYAIAVVPLRAYTLSCWTRGVAGFSGRVMIWDVTHSTFISQVDTNNTSDVFKFYTLHFLVPAGCVSLTVTLKPSLTNLSYAFFDDVSIKEDEPIGQNIRMSVESYTASAGVTPVYRSVVLRGALMPRSTDEITAVVRIADDIQDWQQQPMRSAAAMMGELRDLSNPDRQGLQAHELIDLAGAVWNVKLIGPPQEREVYNGTGPEPPEIAATIRLAVLQFEKD